MIPPATSGCISSHTVARGARFGRLWCNTLLARAIDPVVRSGRRQIQTGLESQSFVLFLAFALVPTAALSFTPASPTPASPIMGVRRRSFDDAPGFRPFVDQTTYKTAEGLGFSTAMWSILGITSFAGIT